MNPARPRLPRIRRCARSQAVALLDRHEDERPQSGPRNRCRVVHPYGPRVAVLSDAVRREVRGQLLGFMNAPISPYAFPLAAAIEASSLPLDVGTYATVTGATSTISTASSAKSPFGMPSASFFSPARPFSKSLPIIPSNISPK